MRLINIHENDYFTLEEIAERRKIAAADFIHELLKAYQVKPETRTLIDIFFNYWKSEHGIKYRISAKDGMAAKQIYKKLAEALESNDPVFIGSVFEKILLSLKGGFYYGKELNVINGGFNTILVEYKRKNEPGAKSRWGY